MEPLAKQNLGFTSGQLLESNNSPNIESENLLGNVAGRIESDEKVERKWLQATAVCLISCSGIMWYFGSLSFSSFAVSLSLCLVVEHHLVVVHLYSSKSQAVLNDGF